jgi:SAM-dependent MidA family methyltransferase
MTAAPSGQALADSRELARRIAVEIDAAGGWIGFDRYMQRALYEPGIGYYSGPNRVFGAEGDFVTAPEMSSLFGRCVAAQCAQWLDAGAGIVEFGAGSGALAAQVLSALRETRAMPRSYAIVELSATLRERQRRTIGAAGADLLERVRWLDVLPERIEGVVLANEVLDAMPVRVFRWNDGEVLERGVARVGDDALGWAERAADGGFAARVRERLREAWCGGEGEATGSAGSGPAQYISEVGEQAEAWVATVGSRLVRGAMLLVDYGFPRHEFYHPQRDSGTLRCHFRHRAHDDPFLWPGLQDITAHVDFSATADAAARAGLDALGFASQARFLLDCGLLEACVAIPRDDLRRWTRETQAVQRLLSEAEMGELFKAIAFGRGVPDDAVGFRTRDRRASL